MLARVRAERVVEERQGAGGVAAVRLEARLLERGGGGEGEVPPGGGEGLPRGVLLPAGDEGEAEGVLRLAAPRPGVVRGQAGDRGGEALLRLLEAAAAEREEPERRVRARVAGVAAERLPVVGLGVEVRVVELLEAHSREVELLHRGDLGGRGRRRVPLRLGRLRAGTALVGHELLPVRGEDGQAQAFLADARGQRHLAHEGGVGGDGGRRLEDDPLPLGQADARVAPRGGRVGGEARLAVLHLEVERALEVRGLDPAQLAHRVPVVDDRPRLARLDPRVVGLVVGVAAGHELDVRPVLVGEDVVPHPAVGPVAPGPELLPRHRVAVGDVHDAGPPAVVVARPGSRARSGRRRTRSARDGSSTS